MCLSDFALVFRQWAGESFCDAMPTELTARTEVTARMRGCEKGEAGKGIL